MGPGAGLNRAGVNAVWNSEVAGRGWRESGEVIVAAAKGFERKPGGNGLIKSF